MPDFGRWTSNGGDPSLNEINRTDRFLDALASQQPVYSTDPSEAELAQLLAGWRDEVRTPPLMAPVTPRDAVVALTRAVESRKRTRTSMALVGSVAAAVLCLGGFGAVVAVPGRATRCTACTPCCSVSSRRRAPIRWRSPHSSWPRCSS
jgi:Anti-sigma-D factor RsdA to sigma factor binding region